MTTFTNPGGVGLHDRTLERVSERKWERDVEEGGWCCFPLNGPDMMVYSLCNPVVVVVVGVVVVVVVVAV